jgi:hypothetical protein
MHVVYLSLEKPTLNRSAALQSLHTIRGLVAAGARVTYASPWPVRRVLATMQAMTGRPLPAEVEVVSVGPGPDLPVLVRLWPAQVWKGIAARLNRLARGQGQADANTVVYTLSPHRRQLSSAGRAAARLRVSRAAIAHAGHAR